MKNVKLCRLIKNVLRKNKIFVYIYNIMLGAKRTAEDEVAEAWSGVIRAGRGQESDAGPTHKRCHNILRTETKSNLRSCSSRLPKPETEDEDMSGSKLFWLI